MPRDALTTRRELFIVLTQGALATAMFSRTASALPEQDGNALLSLWPGYPRQDQKLVAEIVGVSHFDEKRVRELFKAYPELVNAWWDWGYGDWESPLGAAAHVGDRAIAEFLLASGARIDIFAAAMLGMTSVVKAFVEAKPGIQRSLGPHNIALLAHAEAGGEQATDTLKYLRSLGDAGAGPKTESLPEERKQFFLGEYAAETHDLRMVCKLNRNGQLVADFFTSQSQSMGRLLRFTGNDAFFPAGVPSVRVQFTLTDGTAKSATVSGSVPTIQFLRQ
jgi:hypothetical protein